MFVVENIIRPTLVAVMHVALVADSGLADLGVYMQ